MIIYLLLTDIISDFTHSHWRCHCHECDRQYRVRNWLKNWLTESIKLSLTESLSHHWVIHDCLYLIDVLSSVIK